MRREEWDAVIDVHLNSFFILGRIFSKAMLPKRQGRIITIASLSGETGQAGQVNLTIRSELLAHKSIFIRNRSVKGASFIDPFPLLHQART